MGKLIVIAVVIIVAVGLVLHFRPRPLVGIIGAVTNDPLSEFTTDEIEDAALDAIYGRVSEPDDSFFGGTLGKCDQAQRQVDALRQQYANAEPPRWRRALMGWIDFYQREIDEARADIISQASKRDMDAYDERNAQQDKRSALVKDRLRSLGKK